jgi:hypothetical protein
MIFQKKNSSTILPTPSTTCFNKKCVNLIMNKSVELEPFKIVQLDFDIILNVPENYLIKIVNHCENPWQILNSYVNYSQVELQLPITSCKKHTLNPGDIICHLLVQPVDAAYNFLKSKYKIFLKFFIHNL